MKARTFNQMGFGHVAVIFVIVFVAVVGLAGYKVVQMNDKKNKASSSQQVTAPESIKSKEDLEQTDKALESSSATVDGGLNDSSLDADMNDML